ncbi:MAG: hypothetical protein WDZ54_06105 [Sneathiella sp.]
MKIQTPAHGSDPNEMTYSNFEEREIQAYVDNMLEPNDVSRIKKIISQNPEAKKQYLKLLQQNKMLKTWWQRSVN